MHIRCSSFPLCPSVTYSMFSSMNPESFDLSSLPPVDMFSNPAQACYFPYLYLDEDSQGPEATLNDENEMVLNMNGVAPSAPRISPTALPTLTSPTQLPRRAMVSLKHSAVKEPEVHHPDHDAHLPDVVIHDEEAQQTQGTLVAASTRLAGRTRSRRFPRANLQTSHHTDTYQSITCAPTLRHMSFEVSSTRYPRAVFVF